jgi:hypothetical protein
VQKALTSPAPKPAAKKKSRRRGEDTHDLVPQAWRAAMMRTRHAAVAAASIFMSETLDWLHWQHGYTASSSEPPTANTAGNHLSPNP